jgi:gluconolactonase
VKAGVSKNTMMNDILVPGEGWKERPLLARRVHGLAVNPKGELFFHNLGAAGVFRLGESGEAALYARKDNVTTGLAFGPDGRLYGFAGEDRLVAIDSAGKLFNRVSGRRIGADLVVANNGRIYYTEPPRSPRAPGHVRLGDHLAAEDAYPIPSPSGITLSPDQTLLYVADRDSHWVYSYQIQPGGALAYDQQYYWLHVPDDREGSGAGGMCVDRDGRLYVATAMGVQVCDQAGRVNCILPTPEGPPTDVCIGGANFDTLYAACGSRIFYRKLKVKGAQAWDAPTKPAAPRL